jgi:hypothetical protein
MSMLLARRVKLETIGEAMAYRQPPPAVWNAALSRRGYRLWAKAAFRVAWPGRIDLTCTRRRSIL